MQVKLRVIRGSSSGKEVTLKGPKFLIGRAEDCQMRAKSDAISRRHCAILLRTSRVTVRDLGSRNGTYVNGARIDGEHPLADGDVLQVGPLEFMLVIQLPASQKASLAAGNSDSQGVADMVGQWLDEFDDEQLPVDLPTPASETRRFRNEDTDRVVLEADSDESLGGAGPDDPTKVVSSATEKKLPDTPEPAPERSKKGIGKLPKRPPATDEVPRNTQEAAADMLKKLFRRR
jgi:hypothetical protein